jgi:hypothetical protein
VRDVRTSLPISVAAIYQRIANKYLNRPMTKKKRAGNGPSWGEVEPDAEQPGYYEQTASFSSTSRRISTTFVPEPAPKKTKTVHLPSLPHSVPPPMPADSLKDDAEGEEEEEGEEGDGLDAFGKRKQVRATQIT